MWRKQQNEENFSPAKLLAWEFVLPHKHIPIIPGDRIKVRKIELFLQKVFSKQALSAAVKRLKEKT